MSDPNWGGNNSEGTASSESTAFSDTMLTVFELEGSWEAWDLGVKAWDISLETRAFNGCLTTGGS